MFSNISVLVEQLNPCDIVGDVVPPLRRRQRNAFLDSSVLNSGDVSMSLPVLDVTATDVNADWTLPGKFPSHCQFFCKLR